MYLPTVSKANALKAMLLCFGLAVVAGFVIHISTCVTIFVFWGIGFACVWAYKSVRDQNKAAVARDIANQRLVRQIEPSMSSPGSDELFVPAPLGERRTDVQPDTPIRWSAD